MKTDMQVIPVYTCICTKHPNFTVHSLPSKTLEALYYKHLTGRTLVFQLFLISSQNTRWMDSFIYLWTP